MENMFLCYSNASRCQLRFRCHIWSKHDIFINQVFQFINETSQTSGSILTDLTSYAN